MKSVVEVISFYPLSSLLNLKCHDRGECQSHYDSGHEHQGKITQEVCTGARENLTDRF